MAKKKSIGLPSGPNEFLQDITQFISVDGYRNDSVDKTNPVNFIPSGNISMKDVDFPIMGTDNLGNSQMMFPENEYQFPGDMVMEVPQAQFGADIKGDVFQDGREEMPTINRMLPEVEVAGKNKKNWFWNALNNSLNPLLIADNTLQVLGMPAALIRESIEGIGGKGDGEFNFKDIVPDLYNTTIFDQDKAQTPVSQTLGVDGFWAGLGVDLLTDPSTYIGAGLIKNIVAKTGKNVLPNLTKKFLTKSAQSTDDILKQTDNLASEINWGKFNKEIPGNTSLINEYKHIESITKSRGTWMKNADGSDFKGTAEQFVQSKSKNFNTAYPDGYESVYRGVDDPGTNPLRSKSPYSGDPKDYVDHRDNMTGLFSGDKSVGGFYGDEVYNLAMRNSPNSLYLEGLGVNWNDLSNIGTSKKILKKNIDNLKKQIKDGEVFDNNSASSRPAKLKSYENFYNNYDEIVANPTYQKLVLDKETLLKSMHGKDFYSTDNLAQFLQREGLDNIQLNYIDDGVMGKNNINNQIPGNYYKNLQGNNGMFDLIDPNINKQFGGTSGIINSIRKLATDDDYKWTDALYDSTLAPLSNALDVLSVPGALVAEAGEYFGERGDKEFNFTDAIPGFKGDYSFKNMNDTEMKNLAGTLDDEGNPLVENPYGAFALNMFSDPSTYVGAGLIKSGVKKVATKTAPLVKNIIKETDNVVKSTADDMVEVFTSDGTKKFIKKTDAVRLNRIEDANVNNKTFTNYEDGNWFSDAIQPFYLNNAKNTLKGGRLNPNDPKRVMSAYLDPEDAKLFDVTKQGTETALDMSGGKGNLPIKGEYVLPPALVKAMRESTSGPGYNTMIGNSESIMKNLDSFYKKLGGGVYQEGGDVRVPKRKGVRNNEDGTESTHLMRTESLDGENWFSFPSLFQDEDGTWIDMSEEKDWMPVYEEAKRRGEVIDFGTDKETAIKFGKGSWKTKMQKGGDIKVPYIQSVGNVSSIKDLLDEQYGHLINKWKTPNEEVKSWRNIEVNIEGVKKAISQAESLGGKLMKNKQSTASGLYGQRFSELDKYNLYDGSRDEFIEDLDAQNRIFNIRLNEGFVNEKGDTITTPLLKDAYDLTLEYKDQLGDDWNYSYEDIINLSNFIGRGGTRKYFGDVIRDGKSLETIFPKLYGDERALGTDGKPLENKTPKEYLEISREFYQDGGGIVKEGDIIDFTGEKETGNIKRIVPYVYDWENPQFEDWQFAGMGPYNDAGMKDYIDGDFSQPDLNPDYEDFKSTIDWFKDYTTSSYYKNLLEKMKQSVDSEDTFGKSQITGGDENTQSFMENPYIITDNVGHGTTIEHGNYHKGSRMFYNYKGLGPTIVMGGDGDVDNLHDGVTRKGILAHELGHSDRGKLTTPEVIANEIMSRNKLLQDGTIDEYHHDAKPHETRSDLIELRHDMQEKGIFDSTGEFVEFTIEDLKKAKNKKGVGQRLFKYFEDEDIIWFMNNIANASEQIQDDLPPVMNAKYGGSLPIAQFGWNDFEKSKAGKFIDAKGLRQDGEHFMNTVGNYFGYENTPEDARRMGLDASAMVNPMPDFINAYDHAQQGKYTDAALYATFGILPFSAGPLVKGVKNKIINPIKSAFTSAPAPRGTTLNKFGQIKTSFDDLLDPPNTSTKTKLPKYDSEGVLNPTGPANPIFTVRNGTLPLRNGKLDMTITGEGTQDFMVQVNKSGSKYDHLSIYPERYEDGMQLLTRLDVPNAYYIDMSMTNPVDAGQTMKYLEEFMPKGSTISSKTSLSMDSYKLMLNRVKRGKFSVIPNQTGSSGIDVPPMMDLNMMAKQSSDITTSNIGGMSRVDAEQMIEEVNKMLKEAGVTRKAKAVRMAPDGELSWKVIIPNLTLKMEYQKGGELSLPKAQDGTEFLDFITNPIRQRLAENLFPVSYSGDPDEDGLLGGPIDKVLLALTDEKSIFDHRTGDPNKDSRTIQERTDLLQVLMGQDQTYNTIKESKYKPTKGDNNDGTFYSSALTEDEIKFRLSQNGWDSFKNTVTSGGALGNYTIDKGEDEKGKYISYYDKWDLSPFKENGFLNEVSDKLQFWAGINPPEIYGRVYLKDVPAYDKEAVEKEQSRKEEQIRKGSIGTYSPTTGFFGVTQVNEVTPKKYYQGGELSLSEAQEGGEYGVFKNFINGDYDGTSRETYAKDLHDKLNRKHYKQAKSMGMSPANYIMTNVIGNS